MFNIVSLLIIITLSVIQWGIGSNLSNCLFIITDAILYNAINVIYSILAFGYFLHRTRARTVKILAFIAMALLIYTFASLVYQSFDNFFIESEIQDAIYYAK